jgi:fructose-bisphosphate aldolase class II
MVAFAETKGWKKGDYKNLNLPFENKLLAQPKEVRERMTRAVEDFAFKMMTEVLNGRDTADAAIEMILKAGSFDLGPKGARIEEPAEWTDAKILEKAKLIDSDKGPAGKFDD